MRSNRPCRLFAHVRNAERVEEFRERNGFLSRRFAYDIFGRELPELRQGGDIPFVEGKDVRCICYQPFFQKAVNDLRAQPFDVKGIARNEMF